MTRVAVLLSDRLADTGVGLDHLALAERLVPAIPHLSVTAVAVTAPGAIASATAACEADRIVLGLTLGEARAADVEAQARTAGIDPLGVEVVDLGAHAALLCERPIAMERATLLLAGAIARARAFGGSRPEDLRPRISLARSRRALFRLVSNGYRPVPSAHAPRCAAARGCRACVDACPATALRVRDRAIGVDAARCTSCGLCVGTCPTGAISLAGWSDAELDARIDALADRTLSPLEPRGVLFVCAPGDAAMGRAVERGWRYPREWLPVVVPCVGMLSVASLLRALAAGVDKVGLLPCGGACPSLAILERIAFCRDLLAAVGSKPERIEVCSPAADGAWTLPTVEASAPRAERMRAEPARRAAETVLSLARAHGAPADLVVEDGRSPLATIEIDAAACTGCGSCAECCPTGALAQRRDGDELVISFDAAMCGGCGACVAVCPERDVFRLRRGIDRRRLAAGRRALFRDVTPRCVRCGDAVAPAAMLRRVAALLGDDQAALGPALRYCASCRGLATA